MQHAVTVNAFWLLNYQRNSTFDFADVKSGKHLFGQTENGDLGNQWWIEGGCALMSENLTPVLSRKARGNMLQNE